MQYQQTEQDPTGIELSNSAKLLAAITLANHIGHNYTSHDMIRESREMRGIDPQTNEPIHGSPVKADKATLDALHKSTAAKILKSNPEFTGDQVAYEPKIQKSNKIPVGQILSQARPDGSIPPMSDRKYLIQYDPNADKAVLAHEMGHLLAQNRNVENKVNRARHFLESNRSFNSMLKTAMGNMPGNVSTVLKPYMNSRALLQGSKYALPAMLAAGIPGDDDVTTALAANLILSAPELLDEAIASKNALGIMKDAGMPATLKQRGRLAGAWGSYLARPLLAALGGNLAGNLVEGAIT